MSMKKIVRIFLLTSWMFACKSGSALTSNTNEKTSVKQTETTKATEKQEAAAPTTSEPKTNIQKLEPANKGNMKSMPVKNN